MSRPLQNPKPDTETSREMVVCFRVDGSTDGFHNLDDLKNREQLIAGVQRGERLLAYLVE